MDASSQLLQFVCSAEELEEKLEFAAGAWSMYLCQRSSCSSLSVCGGVAAVYLKSFLRVMWQLFTNTTPYYNRTVNCCLDGPIKVPCSRRRFRRRPNGVRRRGR